MPTIKGGVKIERGKPIPSKILKVARKERLLPFRADGWRSESAKLDELVLGSEAERAKRVSAKRKRSRKLPSFRRFRREKKNKRYQNLEDLIKIEGIGEETLTDIRVVWKSLKDLKDDLKSGRHIPLRNDVVEKLKKELL